MITRTLATIAVAVALAADSPGAQKAAQFEVASIRVREPLDLEQVRSGAQSAPRESTESAGRVDILGVSLGALLAKAFNVRPDQLSGPPWLVLDPLGQLTSGEPRFDIHATMPSGATPDQVPAMLQALLVERFKLKFHRDRRHQATLVLVVDPAGPKLLEVRGAAEATNPPRWSPPIRTLGNGTIRLERDSMTMGHFAGLLTTFLRRPIVDLTGLPGAYQIVLDLSVADVPIVTREPNAQEVGDPGGGSLLRSLEKLGLRLESRMLPADCIVIDHIARLPTPN